MKKLTVIIQPVQFEALKKKLYDMGITGITVSNVEGYGFQKRRIKVLKDDDIAVDFLPRVKAEIVLKGSEVEKVVSQIVETTRTGRIGDGKIFISEITDVIRIRTGERNEDGL